MKKSLGVLSRAALISITVALVAAPAALAVAAPATGSATAPTAPAEPAKNPLAERVEKFHEASLKIEADAKAALASAEKAKTKAEAQTAKDAAANVKKAAEQLDKDIQVYLNEHNPGDTHELRIRAGQAMTRARTAGETADKAIAIAGKKLDTPAEPPVKSQLFFYPDTAARGDVIGVAVFCAEGKGGGFSSAAIDFVPESQYEENGITAIGGLVKKDAKTGPQTVTATCGTEKVTGTFQVTSAPPVAAKPPTADDVRRKAVIRPKGRIETGGGATAQLTV